jgi:hypothetical protein
MDNLRHLFKYLNRYFMVPVMRMGLGWLLVNPVSGYIMVIKNIGRKSGKLYYTPTNYAILNGCVYCSAGFGRRSHWYLNMTTNPHVELLLPGRAIWGEVEEVTDDEEALTAIKQIFKNAGLAGFLEGYNPRKAPDEKFLNTLSRAPVLRITPKGIGSGPMDADGWHWVSWALLTAIVVILLLVR